MPTHEYESTQNNCRCVKVTAPNLVLTPTDLEVLRTKDLSRYANNPETKKLTREAKKLLQAGDRNAALQIESEIFIAAFDSMSKESVISKLEEVAKQAIKGMSPEEAKSLTTLSLQDTKFEFKTTSGGVHIFHSFHELLRIIAELHTASNQIYLRMYRSIFKDRNPLLNENITSTPLEVIAQLAYDCDNIEESTLKRLDEGREFVGATPDFAHVSSIDPLDAREIERTVAEAYKQIFSGKGIPTRLSPDHLSTRFRSSSGDTAVRLESLLKVYGTDLQTSHQRIKSILDPQITATLPEWPDNFVPTPNGPKRKIITSQTLTDKELEALRVGDLDGEDADSLHSKLLYALHDEILMPMKRREMYSLATTSWTGTKIIFNSESGKRFTFHSLSHLLREISERSNYENIGTYNPPSSPIGSPPIIRTV